MSAESSKWVRKMHPDDVYKFVRNHEDPGVTAKEVAQAFDVMRQETMFKLNQAWGELKSVMISWGTFVGAAFLPIIEGLASALRTVRQSWDSLSQSMQRVVGVAVGVSAALGPVLWFLGAVGPSIATAVIVTPPVAGLASRYAYVVGLLGLALSQKCFL